MSNWAEWGERVERELTALRELREEIEEGGTDEMTGLILIGFGRKGYTWKMSGLANVEHIEEAIDAYKQHLQGSVQDLDDDLT